MSSQGIPVLVTTQHRGVFYGRLKKNANRAARSLILDNCRNVLYWSGKGGFLGLAASGPDAGSRLGATAPSVLLHDITSVTECTPAAARALEEWQ